ncbi:LytTR family DNA-binding domain-containing protein [Croceicoccus sp. F390]|uniref:LytTR family DNA-binding domain-containing protein n=1 Tax=Croceicoccus esteveae TaxID=3075597 RepID=A0ABU2ZHH4_9SPHN|nr:LytTR family DNA-binding domain-containing protein [Croceicoccus sp. F390]MDT0575749.1 LytTR family DNA-binding domain-containing protein [Croceicoccus sp. F390]
MTDLIIPHLQGKHECVACRLSLGCVDGLCFSRMVCVSLSRSERLLAEFGIVAAVGCGAALLNLFSLPDIPLGARLAFALVGFVAAWVVVRLLAIVGTAAARLLGLSKLWGYVFAIPLSSAAIAWTVLWFLGGPEAALGEGFSVIWPRATLVGVGFFGLFFIIYWRASASNEGNEHGKHNDSAPDIRENEIAGVPESALHERLQTRFPSILALSVEDHYVRVIAEDRSEMLLLSLAEAIELMPDGTGEQVHRSWWVARSAVVQHRRQGRDIRLVLLGGIEIPVSRAMVKTLRETGWL